MDPNQSQELARHQKKKIGVGGFFISRRVCSHQLSQSLSSNTVQKILHQCLLLLLHTFVDRNTTSRSLHTILPHYSHPSTASHHHYILRYDGNIRYSVLNPALFQDQARKKGRIHRQHFEICGNHTGGRRHGILQLCSQQ